MDRQKNAALFAFLILAGGAWWYLRQRQPAGAADAGGFSASLPDFAPIVYAMQDVADTVTVAINPGGWTPPSSAAPYLPAIAAAEDAQGIPRNLLARLLYQESHYRPEIINGIKRSSAGAIGIAQFMPATAAEMGIDPLDPFASIDAAARYLRRLYNATGSDWKLALASYNWGIGNVTRKGIAAAPAETRDYVAQISAAVGLA